MRTQIDRLSVLLKTDLDHWGVFHHHLNKNWTLSQNPEQSICSKTQGEQNQLPCHSPQTPNSSVQTRTTPHLLLLNWSLSMIKGAVLGSEEKSMVPAFQGVHMCKRQMRGTEREDYGGRAGVAELRTNQLQVVNWNVVTSTLKPPWSQLCVPSWAPAFLWKENHQHGLLAKPTPRHTWSHRGPPSALVPGLPPGAAQLSCSHLPPEVLALPPTGSGSRTGNPRWIQDLQSEDKTFSAFPSNPSCCSLQFHS